MKNLFVLSLIVGCGGFAGSVTRYLTGIAVQRATDHWQLGTLAANVLGCFVIGSIMTLSSLGISLTPEIRLALATGFCGGFTTMSTMVFEGVYMLRNAQYLLALLYYSGTLLLSLGAFFGGVSLVRLIVRG
jgi:fluoride exporter